MISMQRLEAFDEFFPRATEMRASALNKLDDKQHEMKTRQLSKPRRGPDRLQEETAFPTLEDRVKQIAKAYIMIEIHCWSESRTALHLGVHIRDIKKWKESGWKLA
jgi:hypothetical protein